MMGEEKESEEGERERERERERLEGLDRLLAVLWISWLCPGGVVEVPVCGVVRGGRGGGIGS
jgi:hypothetical protein